MNPRLGRQKEGVREREQRLGYLWLYDEEGERREYAQSVVDALECVGALAHDFERIGIDIRRLERVHLDFELQSCSGELLKIRLVHPLPSERSSGR